MRPDTDYDACLICQKGAYSHSRLMQKLTGYPALLCAITYRKDEIFRIRWAPTQTFWKRIWSVSHSIAPSTLTAQQLTREKASIRYSKTLRSSTSQPVNYKEECFIYGRARTTKSDISLLMISTFDRSTSVWIKQTISEMKMCYTRFVVLTTSALTWWQTIFSTTGLSVDQRKSKFTKQEDNFLQM